MAKITNKPLQVESKISYFKNLDGLRFYAAMGVLLFHYFSYLNSENQLGIWYKYIEPIVNKGHLGVNFFFVLSGFLISYLVLKERFIKNNFNTKNFILRRTLRIWPLYFFVVILSFTIIYIFPIYGKTTHQWIYYVFFTSNFDEILHGSADSYTQLTIPWSISVEEQFYVLWALVIGGFTLKRKNHFLFFFITICIISLTFRFMNVNDSRTMYYHSLSVMNDLSVGAIFAWIYFYYPDKLKKLFQIPKYLQIFIYLLIFLVIVFKTKIFHNSYILAFERIFISLLFVWVILHQVITEKAIFQVGSNKLILYLGKISYGIYMYHALVLFFFEVSHEKGYEIYWTSVLSGGIIITLLISHLSYSFLEKPFLKFKEKFR